VDRLTYSPDGRHIILETTEPGARLWDADTGKEVRRFPTGADFLFTPDGKALFAVDSCERRSEEDRQARIRCWDTANGQELATFRQHEQGLGGFAFSPDGKTLVSKSGDGMTALWDVAARREVRQLPHPARGEMLFAFSADGKTSFSLAYDGLHRYDL